MPGTQRRGPGSEEIAQEAGHRWSPPLYRTGGRCIYPPACPSRHLGQYGLAAAGAHECAGRSLSCLCYRSHKLEHDAPAPSTTGSASEGPRPFSAVAPRVIAAGIPGGCRHAEPVQSHSCRAESGKAPPCMRWRGLARPRRTGWPVAWPCRRRVPPAGARHPREGPVSRLLPRSRGRPQVVPVSSGEIFLLHTRAPRKSLRAAISVSSAIHDAIHRKRAVIRISRRLSTGY